MTDGSAYAVEVGDIARDRDAVLAIFQDSLDDPAHRADKYDWFYRDCPWGAPLLMLLRHGAEVVGVAAAGSRHMLWRGAPVQAGIVIDFAVATAHRSLGPALLLQQALAEAGAKRFQVLYGFPNPKAVAVVKRAGYVGVGAIRRHARVLRHAGYLTRHLPRVLASPLGWLVDGVLRMRDALRADRALAVAWSERCDPRMDALWRESAHGEALIGARDCAFLAWRFDRAPAARVRYLLVSARGQSALRAWFACQSDGEVLHVRDYWSIDAASGIARAYVLALLNAARREGHASVSFRYAGADERLTGWRDAGFVERYRQPVVAFNGRLADTALCAESLHLTAADTDM